MDESEKLTALKKAYADIILNTAKEAAARIMVSERKATRFQQELASTKEESLRMLLRLKQMLDSKVKEAEVTSLSQQRKIDELEAQLQEAEEIVRDLRAELRETQDVLENVTKHQMNPLVEQSTEGEVAAQENFLQEKRLDPYNGSVHSPTGLQFESVSMPDTKYPSVNGTNDGSTFCVSRDHTNNGYIHNPNFASIVNRRKEPELYRNGCTQRIRAFERNLFDENMSVSENLDNVRDETLVGVHEEGKAMTVTANGKADTICEKEKPDELKVMKADADLIKVPLHRKKRRLRTRKTHRSRLHSDQVKETNKESFSSGAKDSSHVLNNSDPSKVNSSMAHGNEAQKDLVSSLAKAPADATATVEQPDELKVVKADANPVKVVVHRKHRRFGMRKCHRSRLHSDRIKKTNKESYLSCKDSPYVLGNNDPSVVISSMENENEAQKDLMSSVAKAPTDITATVEQSGSHMNTEEGDIFLKACSASNKTEGDKEPLDKSDLTRHESLSTESMEVTACKDVKATDGSPNIMDPKVSDLDQKVPSPSVNDKFLKYTFQRKRKKGLVSSDDVASSVDNCNSKKICGEKQNGHAEPQKSCTMTESSRDSRRLAQVARQEILCVHNCDLISLSEKKWWQ